MENTKSKRIRKNRPSSTNLKRNGKSMYQRKNKKRNNGPSLNPALLIKKANDLKENAYITNRTFKQMPIHSSLQTILTKKGYLQPTEIQDKTLENIIDGNDIVGIAQTGTGKTGAFLIPVIHNMLNDVKVKKTLVVVPTRELAIQVEQEFKSMTKGLKLFSECFIGGTNINSDIKKLRRNCHLVVGTPGRLLDLVRRKALNLNNFSILILDEFDRMLDMGFIDDVQNITKAMHNRIQTLLFSATEDIKLESLIQELLNTPIKVKVSKKETTCDHIEQGVLRVQNNEEKYRLLLNMLQENSFSKVLVFAETKKWVDRVYIKLKKSGIRVDQIHGDKSQSKRQIALNNFKNGKIQVLVATDVASRGLDVLDISHVINYQLPRTYEDYIHRIGRTGRAGKGGKAFTFVN